MGEHALGWMGLSALGWSLDKKRRRQWIAVGASAFTAHAASVVIKRIVRRKRPDYSYVRVGVGTPSKLSFPSSHSTSTTAFLVAVARLYGTSAPLAGIPVMMLSRRSEEHTSELQSRGHLVCRLLLEKKKNSIENLSKP